MNMLDNDDIKSLGGVKRLGIFGGSFNPPHMGHMHVAKVAMEELGLDSIWWLLSPHSAFKKGLAPVEARKSAVMNFIGGEPNMRLSMAEVNWDFYYTKDTINALKSALPSDIAYYFLVGEDTWKSMNRWNGYKYILNNIPIVVVRRRSSGISFFRNIFYRRSLDYMRGNNVKTPSWCMIKAPYNMESSTRIRAQNPNKDWWK